MLRDNRKLSSAKCQHARRSKHTLFYVSSVEIEMIAIEFADVQVMQ